LKKIDIRKKLEEIDFDLESISLGDFDYIGEYTAKKSRNRDSELYRRAGCFFRPNYERGILIYALITKFRLDSFLEIGFGRGYASLCASMAFRDAGIDGKVVTIDPELSEEYLKNLSSFIPKELFNCITFIKQTSQNALPQISENFDLIYIDGDHRYEAVKSDWENTKDKYDKFLIFDDYVPSEKTDDGIQCAMLIDGIEDDTKELITMDRRIFFDDRGVKDEDMDYGQVILTNKNLDKSKFIIDW
jgi:predicted O-methyltransferase YrrM